MFAIQLAYDEYTPAVESQITRDLIALRNSAPSESFAAICDKDDATSLLDAFGIPLFPTGAADLCVVYKVGEHWPEHPSEMEVTIVERDLHVSDSSIKVNGDAPMGYYMPQQGRPIRNQVDLSRRGPQGKGLVDPAVLLTWGGGPGMDYGSGIF